MFESSIIILAFVCMIVGAVVLAALILWALVAAFCRITGVKMNNGFVSLDRFANPAPLPGEELYPRVDYDGHTEFIPVVKSNEDRSFMDEMITPQQMPGISYLAGRPIEAQSKNPDFMEMTSIMRHQL